MRGSPREAAVKVIQEVMEEKSFSNLAVNEYLKNTNWSEADANLFVTLVYGTLEQYQLMNFFLQKISRRPIKKLDPGIRILMLVSIYQLMNLDRVPDYAVVNEAVNLSRKINPSASGFVNGALRNIIRQKKTLKQSVPKGMDSDSLALRFSYPKWIIKELLKEYNEDTTINILTASQKVPDVFIRCNRLKCHEDELISSLKEEGVLAEKTNWLPEALRIEKASISLTDTAAYQSGWFQIQSISSMLAVDALDPQPGDQVLDMAAAPGGKSLFMAERMKDIGFILARDLSVGRLKQLEEHRDRMGITCIKTQVFNATQDDPSLKGKMDKILLDAPCSSLGMIRRKPEIKYANKSKGTLKQMATLGLGMLEMAAEFVRPGGCILYSTCTLFSYENQDVVYLFLEKHPHFQLTPEGMKFLNPAIHPDLDGFFMAKLKRLE
ncbi:MAG: 16S rRNA (cytosine(967)-C(5))-methyltransferase RsmB [Tindallia sp. MSAO_Bac2]|nr:MAG: 16S rRNA (cytosine(967)-C(5))-methyltransferase RsmB [Tindallia sp. MSAO_Bac2]